jgi:XapX domain-containing protein
MTSAHGVAAKSLLGLGLAFAIGFACRTFGIPSPAPPVIVGALLVVAMTTGYLLMDGVMARPAIHSLNCAGRSGLAASSVPDVAGAMDAAHAENAHARSRPATAAGRILRSIALLGLCGAYLQGGLQKLGDFGAVVSEAQHLGLPVAPLVTAATIVTELRGSLLVLSGYYRWIGALWLAGFTLAATFVANRFWDVPLPGRFALENAFFEHLGLVGGFLLLAGFDLRQQRGFSWSRSPHAGP